MFYVSLMIAIKQTKNYSSYTDDEDKVIIFFHCRKNLKAKNLKVDNEVRKEKNEVWINQKTSDKITVVRTYLSIIILNLNELNYPKKDISDLMDF